MLSDKTLKLFNKPLIIAPLALIMALMIFSYREEAQAHESSTHSDNSETADENLIVRFLRRHHILEEEIDPNTLPESDTLIQQLHKKEAYINNDGYRILRKWFSAYNDAQEHAVITQSKYTFTQKIKDGLLLSKYSHFMTDKELQFLILKPENDDVLESLQNFYDFIVLIKQLIAKTGTQIFDYKMKSITEAHNNLLSTIATIKYARQTVFIESDNNDHLNQYTRLILVNAVEHFTDQIPNITHQNCEIFKQTFDNLSRVISDFEKQQKEFNRAAY